MKSARTQIAELLLALVTGLGLTRVAPAAEPEHGLFKSTDRGATWVKAGQGLSPNARINALSLAGPTAIAGTDRGIFVSHDAGLNWQAAAPGVGKEARVLCLAAAGSRIFAGTHQHGVLASDDGGTQWRPVNDGLTDHYVRSLLAAGTNLYAGTDRHGVFVAGNAGASWTGLSAGLPEGSQVFDLAELDGTVFAALYSKGLHRWDARSSRWMRAGEVVPLEMTTTGSTLVVGHNPGGVFTSEDRGSTWQDGNTGLPVNAPVWTLAAGAGRVFVGTTGKLGPDAENISLFSSQDEGRTWRRSDAGLPASSAAVSFAVKDEFVLVGLVFPKLTSPPEAR